MSYKKNIVVALVVLLLATSAPAFAQETVTTDPTATPSPFPTRLFRNPTIVQRAADIKTNVMERTQEIKENVMERREMRMEKREQFVENVKEKRIEAKEQFKEKRTEFKEKVETIRDEKKQQVVERIDTKMSTVNKNKTDKMTEAVNKLAQVVENLKTKGATAKAAGQDTTALDAAIVEAETALALAQEAITTQAGEEYVIEISEEEKLKNDVGSVVSQLRTDLSETHKTVIDAKQAVQNAAKELAKLRRPTVSISPSVIASPTPAVTDSL
jgi:hypothetical protein